MCIMYVHMHVCRPIHVRIRMYGCIRIHVGLYVCKYVCIYEYGDILNINKYIKYVFIILKGIATSLILRSHDFPIPERYNPLYGTGGLGLCLSY